MPHGGSGEFFHAQPSLPPHPTSQNLVDKWGQKLFVGVDEYDAPANSSLFSHGGAANFERMADLLKKQFFSILKQAYFNGIVQKYWLTGVLPAFRDGVSPLSVVDVISKDSEYNDLCGLTNEEVHSIASAYLGHGQDLEATLQEMKTWFNGYRFSSQSTVTLYNPQQVFSHLKSLHSNNRDHAVEDIDAAHSANVLDIIRNVEFVPDFFATALDNRLSNKIKSNFGPGELLQLGKEDEDLAKNLLFYFGVLTYASDSTTLCIPNVTMRRFVSLRNLLR